jgi:hypothetical protein
VAGSRSRPALWEPPSRGVLPKILLSDSPAVDAGTGRAAQAQRLLWPVAVIVFLFTISYPANDILRPDAETLTFPGFLGHVAIALATVVVVFAVVLPWALRRESSGAVALALSIIGTLSRSASGSGSPKRWLPGEPCSAGPGSTRPRVDGCHEPRS